MTNTVRFQLPSLLRSRLIFVVEIVLSTLEDLRNSAPPATEEGEKDYIPKGSLQIPKPLQPTHLSFAKSDEVLVVGLNDSSVAVYDSAQLLSSPGVRPEPLFQLPNSSGQGPIIQILNNPGDLPNLFLLLREATNVNGAAVEVVDVSQRAVISGWKGSPADSTTPTAGMSKVYISTIKCSRRPLSVVVSERETARRWNAKRRYHHIPSF